MGILVLAFVFWTVAPAAASVAAFNEESINEKENEKELNANGETGNLLTDGTAQASAEKATTEAVSEPSPNAVKVAPA